MQKSIYTNPMHHDIDDAPLPLTALGHLSRFMLLAAMRPDVTKAFIGCQHGPGQFVPEALRILADELEHDPRAAEAFSAFLAAATSERISTGLAKHPLTLSRAVHGEQVSRDAVALTLNPFGEFDL